MRVLAGDRERAAHVLEPVAAQVAAVERDRARARVEEPQQQVDDRGLAGAARPDQRDPAAGLEAEVEAVEHRGLVGA